MLARCGDTMRLTRLLILMLLWALPAHAQSCTVPGELSDRLDQTQQKLDRIGRSIEGVPPGDRDFILQEEKAALDSRNSARFRVIAAHRYYAAAKAHAEIEAVRAHLARARSNLSGRRPAQHAIDALRGYAELSRKLHEYIDNDAQRAEPILSRTARQDLYFLLQITASDIANAAKCAVDLIGA